MVHTNQVSTLEVEAVQLVAGLFRIHDILIDNESSAFGVGGNALTDLSAECVSQWPMDVIASMTTYRIGPNLPKSSNRSSGVTV